MQTRTILLSLALTSLSMASPSEVPASETKAASPLINCGCQCAPLTFRDAQVSSVLVSFLSLHFGKLRRLDRH